MKRRGDELKKEVARDFLALGSWVFYLIVLVRATLGPFYPFIYQLVFSAAVLIVLSSFIKDYDGYLARALLLGALTTLFYSYVNFGIFMSLIYIGMIISSNYLGSSNIRIIKGISLGVVSVVLGYYLSGLIG